MKKIRTLNKRIISIALCVAMLCSLLPMAAIPAAAAESTSIADGKTLNDWQSIFDPQSSRNAGQVFLDKSVYTASEALADPYFADVRNNLQFGTDNFGNENFMIALSALGSNSEILGYTYTPTDTMLILDASTSMGTGDTNDTAVDDMIRGANEAMTRLLALNGYNRVGVVVYNGEAEVLLPLARYSTTNANGNFLQFERAQTSSGNSWWGASYENRIRIASGVRNESGAVAQTYSAQGSGTYTQGGIYQAAQQLLAADPIIEDGKIQGGTHRIPIMVLMTDGEPSYRTETGSNTTINAYNAATNANCDDSDYREDDVTAFSTMLTASWAENEIAKHYGESTRFYTLGYNLSSNNQYAHNVLDPLNPNNALATRFAGYERQYLALDEGETGTFRNENNQTAFRVRRLTDPNEVTSLDYVDRYWQAAQASQLTAAFDSIVNEIVIQSRYYSTLVESNNYNQDGFISFTDEIGTHMEVKNIKGLYIGEGKLVSGGMFAEFATTGRVTGIVDESYTQAQLQGFDTEILSAIEERFSINRSQASALLNSAKQNGFISYTDRNNFSNYIAWYADAENNYLAPHGAGDYATAPQNAKYIVRSYFYMGDVLQSHVETSMLYALVRVREDLQTGRQIVDMNVPASLLPMVTYTITVDGDEFTENNITGMTCAQKKPISLLYEVGLDADLNPINLKEKMEGQSFRQEFVGQNPTGRYQFYSNRWRTDEGKPFEFSDELDPHVFHHGVMNTTVTQYIPSLENPRLYFTENAPIYDENHRIYTGAKPTAQNGHYHTRYQWVAIENNVPIIQSGHNDLPQEIFALEDAIIQIEGKEGWFIKKGTPQFNFGESVHGESAHRHQDANNTNTLAWADYPDVVYHDDESHQGFHVLNYLGNNGRVTAAPGQGIKLTKTVAEAVAGAPDAFDFEVTFPGAAIDENAVSIRIERADGAVETPEFKLNNGILKLTLGDGDVAYIVGLPTGTAYEVSEAYNSYYTAASTNASGTIAEYEFAAVDFVNSPIGYGSLLVEKDVIHTLQTVSDGLENKEFDLKVTFAGTTEQLGEIVAPAAAQTADNGVTYTFKLKDGQDVLFTHIPEGVTYQVAEENIPAGFTLQTAQEALQGTVRTDQQSEVLVVNSYAPLSVHPSIIIQGDKTIDGRDWDSTVDQYTVVLQQVTFGGQGLVAVENGTYKEVQISDAQKYSIDMSDVEYTAPGAYSYVVYEYFPGDAHRVPDVSYDTTFAMFTVTVIDDGSGQLKIGNVQIHQNTAGITETEGAYNIEKDFQNRYLATRIDFSLYKEVVKRGTNETVNAHRGGLIFGVFDSVDAETPLYYTITDDDGLANFRIPVKKSDYTVPKTLYLREIAPAEQNQQVGMTYNTAVQYELKIDWSGEELSYAFYKYGDSNPIDPAQTPLVIRNEYDENVTASIEFGGNKTLNGGELREGDRFTIELYETNAAFQIDGVTPETKSVTKTQSGYTFEKTFDAADLGTHYFVIKEAASDKAYIENDPAVYHITVNVTKESENNKAILKAAAIHVHKVGSGTDHSNDPAADQINFNNSYKLNDSVEIVLSAEKNLIGRALIEGEFTFGIYEQEDSATPLLTARNAADGSVTFPAITKGVINGVLDYEQTYDYYLKEIAPAANEDHKGIAYSDAIYKIVVELADNGAGELTKSETLYKKTANGYEIANEAVFENTYSATNTATVTFGGTKYLENLNNGTFEFELFETDETFALAEGQTAMATANATLTDAASADYRFTLSYRNKAEDLKAHYYVLKEKVPAETKGILYDSTEYHLTIDAFDNGHGEIEAQIVKLDCPYTDDVLTADGLNFINKYQPQDSEPFYVEGTKKLSGRELVEGEFEFELYQADDRFQEGALLAEAKNAADGAFRFDYPLTFEQAGEYRLLVKEKKLDTARVTFDERVFGITLTVADNGEGAFVITEKEYCIVGAQGHLAAEKVEFQNVYTPKPEDLTVEFGIDKAVVNKGTDKIGPDGFEFVLENQETHQQWTAKSDLFGKAKIALTYTEADIGKSFAYTIREIDGGKENVTYDPTVYEITVEIEKNEQNKLIAAITQSGKAVDAVAAKFENEYDYTPTLFPDPDPIPDPDPVPDPIPDSQPEPQPEPKPEAKPEPKPEQLLSDNPDTGDHSNLRLWLMLLLLSGGALLGTALLGKKAKETE
ncbi:MAG: VWA domain-containing protein [Clostridia bacterium]|nr:VWA domain-containing protein [Clostridia bacterium]